MPLFPFASAAARQHPRNILPPETSAREHNERINVGFFYIYKKTKTILEQSRKRGAMPGAVALLAGAAFSLCDTRLWVCPWAGGTQEPNATTSQPQRAPMHRHPASLKPQRWEIIKPER